MTRITGAELAGIERDVDVYFDKTALIFVPTTARDQSGGTTVTMPTNPTRTSPCQIAPMGNEIEAQYAEKLGGRQGFVVSLRDLVRVPVTARIKVDGRTYEVLGSNAGRSYMTRQRVPVKELT